MNFTEKLNSPIHQLKESTNNNNFYIKREDLLPISFGGNKARKAALFFQDFKRKKTDCIVTYGASSSNHCRIIANIAASNEIPCYIISPSESSQPTVNRYMVELFEAEIIETPITEVKATIDKLLNKLKESGRSPYFIQGGGHGNIGTQAYVEAYEEIVDFEKLNKINFDYIFLSSGTGTTQAGLVCGKYINNNDKKIIGISNARKKTYGKKVIFESVNDYLKEKRLNTINTDEITFIDDYIVKGYGTYNVEILKVVKEILVNEGIPLDPTYTGKAYWGMREYIKRNNISNENILFIHTGGTPLFFETLEEL